MSDDHYYINVYIIGNTGVGKSFLCNCLVARNAFESANQPYSCTRNVESMEVKCTHVTEDHKEVPFALRVFNIPGLLEADPARVKDNVRLLQSALDRKQHSVVLYVLTTESGRIRDGDYVAFSALKTAYDLTMHACAFIVNKSHRRDNQAAITSYINTVLAPFEVWFLPEIQTEDDHIGMVDMTSIKNMLLVVVNTLTPNRLTKKSELKLDADYIQELKEESQKRKQEFESQLQKMKSEKEQCERDVTNLKYQLERIKQHQNHVSNRRHRGFHVSCGPLSFQM
jgi:septin family protein